MLYFYKYNIIFNYLKAIIFPALDIFIAVDCIPMMHIFCVPNDVAPRGKTDSVFTISFSPIALSETHPDIDPEIQSDQILGLTEIGIISFIVIRFSCLWGG